MTLHAELSVTGTAKRIEGPLVSLERNVDVGLGEAVEIEDAEGRRRLGRIASLDESRMIVEVLESTLGLTLSSTRLTFAGEPLSFGLGERLLGRVLDGVGRPIDGGPPLPVERWLPIDGKPMNPTERVKPHEFIETGLTALDLLNSLVRGQKLPLFSEGGLPHDRMIAELAQRARLRGQDGQGGGEQRFVVVFVGIGLSYDSARAFRSAMEASGALEHTLMFLNHASESSTQRLLAPRFALTAAEYLAFEQQRHVLVVLTDMTNYCAALREVSASHGEVPGRKGYPGYMYSDLASLYERAGILAGKAGSLTELAVLTVPSGDISHPIADLTGYITEGQIVLDRALDRRGIYPPVKILPSLSRLMKDGIGAGRTDPDHPALAAQLYAAYARASEVRTLASVVGVESLMELDKLYLHFGDELERRLIHQEHARTLEESLQIGWELLKLLPIGELGRLSERQLDEHVRPAGDG
jgi:V/A-type H+/Na+-transporting ATPase subunit B